MDLDTLARQFRKFDEVEFAGGVSDQEIDAAAERIGLPIEGGYRAFLRRFGCGAIEHEEFIGLGGDGHLDVVTVTRDLRARSLPRAFPSTFIPVLADGYGNYDCIDTTRRDNGEFPVVAWVHDGDDNPEQLAPNYLEWFNRKLQEIRDAMEEDE